MPISFMEQDEYNAMENPGEEEEENEEKEMPKRVTLLLCKLYRMVQNSETNDIISWKRSGNCFVNQDKFKFENVLLLKCFKHRRFDNSATM
ncbi:hypothetical protein C3L33_04955, partial [Rhododendron williamsianum]